MQFQGRQSCYYTRSFSLLASCLFASCTVIYMKICSPHENISAITCLIRTSFFHPWTGVVSFNKQQKNNQTTHVELIYAESEFRLEIWGFSKKWVKITSCLSAQITTKPPISTNRRLVKNAVNLKIRTTLWIVCIWDDFEHLEITKSTKISFIHMVF